LTLLSLDGQSPQFIISEREYERVDGGTPDTLVAHTGNPEFPAIRWGIRFKPTLLEIGVQWHDDEIGVASC
jgi:hypothetical protein